MCDTSAVASNSLAFSIVIIFQLDGIFVLFMSFVTTHVY